MSSGSPSLAQQLRALARAWQLSTPEDERLASEVERLACRRLAAENRSLERRAELVSWLAEGFGGGGVTNRSRLIADAAQRYADERWHLYRDSVDVPADHAGKVDEWFWRLHRLAEEVDVQWPVSASTVYGILRAPELRTASGRKIQRLLGR